LSDAGGVADDRDRETKSDGGHDTKSDDAGSNGIAACAVAGGRCLLGGPAGCANVGPQDCNPDRNPGGAVCCLDPPMNDCPTSRCPPGASPVMPPGEPCPIACDFVVGIDGAGSECRFEYLGEWVRCEEAGWPYVEWVEGARTLQDCVAECLSRPECTAVTDYFGTAPELGCALYTSTCEAPFVPIWGEEDRGVDYRKGCR
jgi:hypothetical protein